MDFLEPPTATDTPTTVANGRSLRPAVVSVAF